MIETEASEHLVPEALASTAVVNLFPGISPDVLVTAAAKSHSLILETNALGGVQRELIPVLEAIIASGKPVFLVSDNPSADHGVLELCDRPSVDAARVGCIHLEKANTMHMREVAIAVSDAVQMGLRGTALGECIREKYAYGTHEVRPAKPLGTPAYYLRFRRRVAQELMKLQGQPGWISAEW